MGKGWGRTKLWINLSQSETKYSQLLVMWREKTFGARFLGKARGLGRLEPLEPNRQGSEPFTFLLPPGETWRSVLARVPGPWINPHPFVWAIKLMYANIVLKGF